MVLEIDQPLPPRWLNWRSFHESLWRLGPELLTNIPPELKPLIRLLVEDPGMLGFDPHETVFAAFNEFWDEDPEEAVREALRTWADAVRQSLQDFGGMELADDIEEDEDARDWEEVFPLIDEIALPDAPQVIALLVDAAMKPE